MVDSILKFIKDNYKNEFIYFLRQIELRFSYKAIIKSIKRNDLKKYNRFSKKKFFLY